MNVFDVRAGYEFVESTQWALHQIATNLEPKKQRMVKVEGEKTFEQLMESINNGNSRFVTKLEFNGSQYIIVEQI